MWLSDSPAWFRRGRSASAEMSLISFLSAARSNSSTSPPTAEISLMPFSDSPRRSSFTSPASGVISLTALPFKFRPRRSVSLLRKRISSIPQYWIPRSCSLVSVPTTSMCSAFSLPASDSSTSSVRFSSTARSATGVPYSDRRCSCGICSRNERSAISHCVRYNSVIPRMPPMKDRSIVCSFP